jgi:O6-methylguanine-DNA--protein-cysteine methyltransferase
MKEICMRMTTTNYRAGGANTKIRFAIGECSLGAILVAMSERGVCAISLGDDPDALARGLQDRFPQAEWTGGDSGFEPFVAKVVSFVEAPALGLDLPLDIRGTAFQQRVWQALREIPAGSTASYTAIAKRIDIEYKERIESYLGMGVTLYKNGNIYLDQTRHINQILEGQELRKVAMPMELGAIKEVIKPHKETTD